jgi:hypothetical protein
VKEEGRRKREEGRRKREEGRRLYCFRAKDATVFNSELLIYPLKPKIPSRNSYFPSKI